MLTKIINPIVFLTTFFTFGMIAFLITLQSCTQPTEKTHVFNINMKIVSINGDCSLSQDKFHNPQLCNTILFQTLTPIDGDTLYRELNTCTITNMREIHIDTEWLYNHRPGDIVHFDYLLKSKFFKIKKR